MCVLTSSKASKGCNIASCHPVGESLSAPWRIEDTCLPWSGPLPRRTGKLAKIICDYPCFSSSLDWKIPEGFGRLLPFWVALHRTNAAVQMSRSDLGVGSGNTPFRARENNCSLCGSVPTLGPLKAWVQVKQPFVELHSLRGPCGSPASHLWQGAFALVGRHRPDEAQLR